MIVRFVCKKFHTSLQPDTTSENCSQGSSGDDEADFVPDADADADADEGEDGRESPAGEGARLAAEAAAAEEPTGGGDADGEPQPTQLAQSSDQRS